MRPNIRTILLRTLVVFVIVGIIGYAIFRLLPLFRGPNIVLLEPDNGTVTEPIVTVSGNSARTQNLLINGQTQDLEQNGDFITTLAIPVGYTIIELYATDRFGKKDSLVRHIYNPPPTSTQGLDLPTQENQTFTELPTSSTSTITQ
ncbi:MAG: hypothetical protein OEX08_01620 [Candidatus Nomurabacteria bacterium]|nr:hypothetical protein [Candidatus Nomurabacteria bacterium]